MSTNILSSGGVDRIYKLAFRKHFTNHECNFPPNRPLRLGDYGVMNYGYFERLANIDSLGVNFKELQDAHPGYDTFTSSKDTSVKFYAKGDLDANGVKLGNAKAEISFQSSDSVYFSSAEVCYNQIDNIPDVGRQILELYKAGQWNKNYFVITRLFTGKNTIVLISGSSKCSVDINADVAVPKIDLANGSMGLSIGNTQNAAYKELFSDECQLGMGLSRVYDTIFIKPTFRTGTSNPALFAGLDHTKTTNVVFGDVTPKDYDYTV